MIEVLLVYVDGVFELYIGEINGLCIDIGLDVVVCSVGVKVYIVFLCMYGFVEGYLLWVWDIVVFGILLCLYVLVCLVKV